MCALTWKRNVKGAIFVRGALVLYGVDKFYLHLINGAKSRGLSRRFFCKEGRGKGNSFDM